MSDAVSLDLLNRHVLDTQAEIRSLRSEVTVVLRTYAKREDVLNTLAVINHHLTRTEAAIREEIQKLGTRLDEIAARMPPS